MHVQALMMAQPQTAGPMSASDNFNSYADGSSLAGQGNWVALQSPMAMSIIKPGADGRFVGSDGNPINALYYNSGTWANDQWAEVTIGSGGGGGPAPGACVRLASGSGYYALVTYSFGGLVILYKIDSGTETLMTFTGQAYNVGDVVRITVTGAGSATRLAASVNGSTLISGYDPGGTYYSSGKPGIMCGGNAAGVGDGGTLWSAADV